jgi:hypothetical protein
MPELNGLKTKKLLLNHSCCGRCMGARIGHYERPQRRALCEGSERQRLRKFNRNADEVVGLHLGHVARCSSVVPLAAGEIKSR